MRIKEVKRPWGAFRQFTANEQSTVKIITIAAGGELSLQYHNDRSEFWRIISGHPTVTIGEKVTRAKAGDEFLIAKKKQHRIKAGKDGAMFLEIAFGAFDEKDITRLADKYGRVPATKVAKK
jgi:mannose-1-phosphate guanylyltransferase/mannose-1-phosphate guanylyltransferase/mannose-6-phosphate isomerase